MTHAASRSAVTTNRIIPPNGSSAICDPCMRGPNDPAQQRPHAGEGVELAKSAVRVGLLVQHIVRPSSGCPGALTALGAGSLLALDETKVILVYRLRKTSVGLDPRQVAESVFHEA